MRFFNNYLALSGSSVNGAAPLPMSGTVMTGSVNSYALRLDHISNYSIHVQFQGNASGTLKLQASAVPHPAAMMEWERPVLQIPWVDVNSQAIDGVTPVMWNVQNPGYRFVRVVYTHTTGSGTPLGYFMFSGKGSQ